jgi:hypothetical protein
MRTVSDGNITQALIDTQEDPSKTPYISVEINGTEYWSRLLYLEHNEEPYRERAVIGLSNRDGALDNVNLKGQEFEIGYGYDSSGNGGSATDTVGTATLWVKSIQKISKGGERIYQIYAEGMWSRLRREKVLPGLLTWKAVQDVVEGQHIGPTEYNGRMYTCITEGTTGGTEPDWTTEPVVDGTVEWEDAGAVLPYSGLFDGTHTIQEIMELVALSLGWTWVDVNTSDGIIDTFKPTFAIGQSGYEAGAAILYRLIWMTYCYYRCRPSTTFQPIFREDDEVNDITYFSDAAPYFDEYDSQDSVTEPNSIVVLCNQDPSTEEWGTADYEVIFGTATDDDAISEYVEVVEVFQDGNIRTQEDADARAEAILWRIKQEASGGRILLPFHDCRPEIGDIVGVVDNRV